MAAAHAHSLAAGERERERERKRVRERERDRVLLLNNPPSNPLSLSPHSVLSPPTPLRTNSLPMPDTLASPRSITSP